MKPFAQLLFALSLLTLSACSSVPLNQQRLEDQLQQAGLQPEEVAVVMEPLFDGASPLLYRADAAMAPASTMKLLTTTVALSSLGSDWRGSTRLLLSKADFAALQQRQQTAGYRLTQPLYLQAGSDADFSYPELSALLSQLRANGVTELGAGIVLDRRSFLPERSDLAQADFDDAPKARYNHRPDALYLGQSLQTLKLNSNSHNVQAILQPYWPLLQLDVTALVLTDQPCDNMNLSSLQTELVPAPRWTLRLSGSFAKNCQRQQSFELIDRDQALMLSLLQEWQRLGGTISKMTLDSHQSLPPKIALCCQLQHDVAPAASNDAARPLLPEFSQTYWLQQGTVPPDAVAVAEHFSRPLGELVSRVNKSSDNALSRLLFLTLGTIPAGEPAQTAVAQSTTTAGLAAKQVTNWLTQQQLPTAPLILENGSGLSRLERISPSLLAAVLRHSFQAHYGPELVASLPLAGVDGTLKNRFRQGAAYQKARLKTGTLQDVTALAGYVYDGQNRPWVFVALVNSPNAITAGRPLLDQLVQQLAQYAN